MSRVSWYWHRMRAMSLAEILFHARRRYRQWADARGAPDWRGVSWAQRLVFPSLPKPDSAPEALKQLLRRDVEAISAGRWHAFGRLAVQVDTPPRWQRDYLAGVDVARDAPAFGLNHRELPGGADIKLIWEWSRWYQLGRLAMAAYVLGDELAGRRCVDWMQDWVRHNPPYSGWNWTSALEAGIRLVQHTWIDAWLRSSAMGGDYEPALERLGRALVPAHRWFVWRYRSFGSSANNHLLGELAGLVLSEVRWPGGGKWGAPLEVLQDLWETQVLAQFGKDGGNREQALNYHLFSFEFCWQTRLALLAAGRSVSARVEERLGRAAEYYAAVQVPSDPWDYGDSDDAFVSWLFAGRDSGISEWHQWMRESESSPALHYWLGEAPCGTEDSRGTERIGQWLIYSDTGMAMCRAGDWVLRWDLSPLGYLATAAHGHLDALHVSLWLGGVALIVDPGTGAYYADAPLRRALASWAAHNGPHPVGADFPRREGPFLWAETHARPEWATGLEGGMEGCLALPGGQVSRLITPLSGTRGWHVDDRYVPREPADREAAFEVCWQFAPGASLNRMGTRRYRICRAGISMEMILGENWTEVEWTEPPVLPSGPGPRQVSETIPAGICSAGFRQTALGFRVRLVGHGHNPCLFRTTFLASADS